jgi:hypothetical protein
MRALIVTLACSLAALPAAAQEFQIDITGGTGDQQPASVSFDIDSGSGSQIYNADGTFSFTNVAISDFQSSINGTPYLSASTATALWAKDASQFGGFQITGAGGLLFGVETIIGPGITIDASDPLYSFLSQGIFPAGLGGIGDVNFAAEAVTITPVSTSVPEPGVAPLTALAAAMLLISRRRRLPHLVGRGDRI